MASNILLVTKILLKPLCIILPQTKECKKYLEKGGNNMSFLIKDDDVLVKYNEIWNWNKIKKTLNTKFHSMSVYDEYTKAKVREFSGVKRRLLCSYSLYNY